ncbi:glycosyltransferase [Halobacillus sp. B29]|uniref:glycosyltransferase n=1 Tax=Halobacillus sp. B29 TaxID=3457432 RepID=UPI003FCE345D
MKKNVVFMVINMNIGGTEKALLNMISEMPKEKFNITILMLESKGGFLNYIPDHVNVEVLKGYSTIKKMLNQPAKITSINLLKKGRLIKAFSFSTIYLFTKVFRDRDILFKYLMKSIHYDTKHFDTAIAYAGPVDFISFFVLEKINAKKKIQWIHFDITKVGFDQSYMNKKYKIFDEIRVVSNEAKQKLIAQVPIIKEKTNVYLNKVSPTSIEKLSLIGHGFEDSFNGIRILTVGRLSTEKGQDIAIKALTKLIKRGYKVKWYCLGEGGARTSYEKLIEKYQVEDYFVLLGANSNPYPYMKQCDIYVQPSRYEGYCITILEAKVLQKPIVTTNVNGVKEQINNGKTGLVTDMDADELFLSVEKLIKDANLRNQLVENLEFERIVQSPEVSRATSF